MAKVRNRGNAYKMMGPNPIGEIQLGICIYESFSDRFLFVFFNHQPAC